MPGTYHVLFQDRATLDATIAAGMGSTACKSFTSGPESKVMVTDTISSGVNPAVL